MRMYKIYTAGKMSGLAYKEQVKWRYELEQEVMRYLVTREASVRVKFIHPPQYYSYEGVHHKSEREVKEWELAQVEQSDIVVIDLGGANSSTGTHFEIARAEAANRFGGKHISVLGLGNTEGLHPWIELSLMRVEEDAKQLAKYIVDYLLV